MIEAPNFYAIIPANVRYDKELCPNAKLLYGEITSLCNKEGYCWATNSYFAELYNVSTKSISLWVKQLVEKGYIKSTLIYKEGTNEILHRYLHLCGEGMEKIFHRPMEKKVKENNKFINNKSNNKIEDVELPFCIDKNSWIEWVAFRKQIKKSLTDLTIKKQIKFLVDCFNKGQNPNLIIEQSISNGWTGLFELKTNSKQSYIDRCINESARTYEAPIDENRPF